MLRTRPSQSQCLLGLASLVVVALTTVAGGALSRAKREESDDAPRMDLIEPWRPYFIAHGCEWTYLRISCPLRRVINIVRATYGRQDTSYCPHLASQDPVSGDRICPGLRTKPRVIVSTICNGNTTCEIPVYEGLFGNPCNTFAYLEVYFACVSKEGRSPSRLVLNQ